MISEYPYEMLKNVSTLFVEDQKSFRDRNIISFENSDCGLLMYI